MECHDVRLLLAFAHRSCENLDAAENELLQQHLERCPVCASLAQADRRLDESLGLLMRDVPVPAGLKDKVTAALTAQRAAEPSRIPWKGLLAAAAVLLVTIAAGLAWHYRPLPEVTLADLTEYPRDGNGWTEDKVEEHFKNLGLPVRVPRIFDYGHLQHVDVVEFKGKRVPRLSFAANDRNDPARLVSADVLVFSTKQFRMSEIKENADIRDLTSIRILRETEEYPCVIYYRGGDLDSLMRDLH